MSATSKRELLPTNVRPMHYAVRLEPDLETFKFDGQVTVELEVKEATSTIVLHAMDMEITDAELTQGGVTQALAEPAKAATSGLEGALELVFAQALKAGEGATLQLRFVGNLNDQMAGFYRSKYTQDGEERWMGTTQFEPTDARRAFPCWDEPLLKATFEITLALREEHPMTILSNMDPVKDEVVDGKRVVSFARTPIMSTYLLAWVIGEFEFVEGITKAGTRVRIYTALGKKEQGRFALSMATRTLDFYTEYYGIGYPLPKSDMIAIPDFAAGAMENWGLITYRETALLIDEERSPVSSKQRVAYVVAHELAHQWFGNLVTMEWWRELWLNEGYATYVGNQAMHEFYPQWETFTQFVSQYSGRALDLDSLASSHPIEVEVSTSAQVNEIFDAISYCKGAAVIRMCLDFVGEEAFRKGMGIYLNRHQYANAVTKDLWGALSEACGRDITSFMQNWTRETGYPVLTVSRADGKLQVAQTRFLASGVTDASRAASPLWELSLNLLSKGVAAARRVHVTERETAVALEGAGERDGFLVVNAGATGFFRVCYSAEMLAALRGALEAGELAVIDRLTLQGDAFALARAGLLDTAEALKLAGAYKGEADFTVWSDLLGSVKNVAGVFAVDDDADALLSGFLRDLVAGALRRVGWDATEGEPDMVSMLRASLISAAGAGHDDDAIAEALRRFYAHVEDPTKNSLVGDMRAVVYRLAAWHGGEKAFEALLQLYRTADMHEEKVRALAALGAAKEEAQLRRALELSLSDEVRSQDTFYVIATASGSGRGRRVTWAFVKERWDDFEKRFAEGQFLLARIVSYAVSSFTSEEDAQDVEAFFKEHPTPPAERTIQQGLEKIRAASSWIQRDKDSVLSLLKSMKE